MRIKEIAVDLAKNKFQVLAVSEEGKVIFNRSMTRMALQEWMKKDLKEPCEVMMEACGGAHYWGREWMAKGHDVRLIPPQFVKPYVRGDKTDRHDALAIWESGHRPGLRYVAVKTEEQQDLLLYHTIRSRLIRNRTALGNQIRGILLERGIIIGKGIRKVGHWLMKEMEALDLTPIMRETLLLLKEEFLTLNERIRQMDSRLLTLFRNSELCQRVSQIEGIGVICATGIVGYIADGRQFRNGRQFSAWLGLVPREISSGEKQRKAGITKRGNVLLRTQLIHGARAALVRLRMRQALHPKQPLLYQWERRMIDLKARRGHNRAVVALANRMARVAWALLAHGADYKPTI